MAEITISGMSVHAGAGGNLAVGAGTASIQSSSCKHSLELINTDGGGVAVELLLPNMSTSCTCLNVDCEFASGDTITIKHKNFLLFQLTEVTFDLTCDSQRGGARCEHTETFPGLCLGIGSFEVTWKVG